VTLWGSQPASTPIQVYPVIYLLDGDITFGMAARLTPAVHWSLGAPEVIVVGIGYDIESYAQ
jgi:predicted alpha/beta superfamily hydrolase